MDERDMHDSSEGDELSSILETIDLPNDSSDYMLPKGLSPTSLDVDIDQSLAWLDEASIAPSTNPTSSLQTDTSFKCGKKRTNNPSRNRRQQELKHLRTVAPQLEALLEQLKQSKASQIKTKSHWEQRAKDELNDRLRAETTNANLQSAVALQTQLQSNIMRCRALENGFHIPTHYDFIAVSMPYAVSINSDDSMIYNALLQQTEKIIPKLSTVFDPTGTPYLLNGSECGFTRRSRKHLCDDGQTQWIVDASMSEIIPLPFENVTKKLWYVSEREQAIVGEPLRHPDNWPEPQKWTLAARYNLEQMEQFRYSQIAFLFRRMHLSDSVHVDIWSGISIGAVKDGSKQRVDDCGWAMYTAMGNQTKIATVMCASSKEKNGAQSGFAKEITDAALDFFDQEMDDIRQLLTTGKTTAWGVPYE